MSIANIGAILSGNTQIGGSAIENAVARAYLVKHVNDFDRVDLNVRLGPGITPPATLPSYLVSMAIKNSQQKADMILWRGDYPTIVEVKDRAYASVLGQLLTYFDLMRADNPKLLQVYKVVAAQTMQPGMVPTFDRYNVQVELFPFAAAAAGINQ
jgi:hypothetical protein